MEDTPTQEVEDSQEALMRAQLQGSTQKDTVQVLAGTTGNVVTPVTTDSRGLPQHNRFAKCIQIFCMRWKDSVVESTQRM